MPGSTELSTGVRPTLSVRYQPLCPHCCPHSGVNFGDGKVNAQESGLGQGWGQHVIDPTSSVDNRWISGPDLWTVRRRPQQAWLVHVHRAPVIHRSRAASPATTVVVHMIHRPYDNDET